VHKIDVSLVALAAALLFAPSVASAQDTSAPPPANQDSPTAGATAAGTTTAAPTGADAANTGDIIVTAERRSQSLQKLPTTATAILGKDLDRQQITRVDDLIKSTPGLAINDTGVGKFINIRGVGKSADAPGVAPGAAFYVDGVPIPNQVFLDTPFFDFSRVEVLRGPQGTLVGINSTAGAILLVSQDPVLSHFGGSLEQSFGNYSEYRTRAMVNIGGKTVGLRVDGELENRDSFFKNVGPATDHPGDVDRRTIRATLAFKPEGGAQFFIRGEYNRSRSDGLTGKPVPGDPDPAYLFAFDPASPSKAFDLARSIDTYRNTEYYRVSGEARIDIADIFQLRSVTGFQRGIFHLSNDLGATGIPTARQDININEPVFTQEVNLISNPGGKIDWVVGAFYLHQDTNGLVNVANVPSGALIANVLGRTRIRNVGVFGQTTWHATDKLNATLGLRFNNERHFLGAGNLTTLGTANGTVAIPGTTQRTNDSAVTGRFTLDYALSSTEFAYGTVSRGFKGGGINDPSPTPIFRPETVWNYELGLKSNLLDRKIRTQLGLFYEDIQHLQYNVYNAAIATVAVQNIPGGKTYGVEFQAQGNFGAFGVNTAIAYTESSVDDALLIDPRYGATTATQIGGRAFNFSPKFSFNAGIQYDLAVGHGYTLTPRIQYSHLSSQWATFYHVRPTDYLDARNLIDANILLKHSDSGFSAELYATNLTNKKYIVSKAVEGSFETPGRVEFYGAPRQYGVRIGYSF
jgi:iron complex outermembrane receptor protein